MSIVTLTTDFGIKDHFVASLKGVILSQIQEIVIIDVSHHARAHDILHAAYLIKNSFRDFPAGSIHVITVNNQKKADQCFLALEKEDHFFIAPDNGLLSLIFGEKIEKAIKINSNTLFNSSSYESIALAIKAIASKKKMESIGEWMKDLQHKIELKPVIGSDYMRGSIVHIDRYDNVIINITKEDFEKARKERHFQIYFKRDDPLTMIHNDYSDVPVGEVLCHFNRDNYLQISINMGKAAGLLGLNMDELIQIEFS